MIQLMNQAALECKKVAQLEVPLTVTCPGAFKTDKELRCDIVPKEWHWKSCEHRTYLNDSAYCFCKDCKTNIFIKDVCFKCDDAKHGNSYLKYSWSNFSHALSSAISAGNNDY